MSALLIGGIAILVAQVWLFGFSYAYYGFYLAVGAPEAPTGGQLRLVRWLAVASSQSLTRHWALTNPCSRRAKTHAADGWR
jgi:hypothetical protein